MAREFKLPDIGEGLTEAEIVSWLVAEGDSVEADQPLVEVETDKAVVEIPSPYAGVVLSHGGAEGDVVAVGAVLVVIGDEGEGLDAKDSSPDHPEPAPVQQVAPIVGTLDEEPETIEPVRVAEPAGSSRVKALPIVRKMARDAGIDIEAVTGTGPDGRITRDDIEAAIGSAAPAASHDGAPVTQLPRSEPVAPAPSSQATAGRVTMSRLRRTIAANMSKSWAEIPHVTTFDDVDATRLLAVRAALAERNEMKIPIEALVVKAVIPTLRAFPDFNSTLDGDDLIIHSTHNVGIAVDTPDGLLVAVIPAADDMTVLQLAAEVTRLGEGARDRSLTPGELTGQTFTVSNIGAVGGGHGTPIVPHGTTAILSVGRAVERPIAANGEVVVAPVMPLSLSYDHRVIDGGQGRRFMALLMENLEEPALFLAD